MDADAPGSLRFHLFGFPVAINWSVLFVGALIVTSRLPVLAIVLFFPAAISSILVHELGHAVSARGFGARVDGVVLYLMGGVTTWHGGGNITHSRRFVISAAGSGTEITAGLVVYTLMRSGALGDVAAGLMGNPLDTSFWLAGYGHAYGAFAAGAFVWVSLVWGLLNWLPIGGFDGASMLREVMVRRDPMRGRDMARVVSIAVSVVAVVYFYSIGYRLFALFIVIIALPSLTGSQEY